MYSRIDALWDEYGEPVCPWCKQPFCEYVYEINGEWICEECIQEYVDAHYRRTREEVIG